MSLANQVSSAGFYVNEGGTGKRLRADALADRLVTRQWGLEPTLILVILGLSALLHSMQGYRFVILNVYFLPIALAGFFLGRYRAGVMALLCVLGVSIVTAVDLADPFAGGSPLVVALAVAVWGAVLGLTALLIGTLSDERFHKLSELHDAYVGVVEVLTQYLQSAHPRLKARSIRVAELSQRVAALLKLSMQEIDDIRVGALLYDVGHIEITTRVIRRAMDTLDANSLKAEPQTIQGTDLMLSLGSVLNGAVPFLLSQQEGRIEGNQETSADALLGAKIIRAVRAYDALTESAAGGRQLLPAQALQSLRADNSQTYGARVLTALEQAVRTAPVPSHRPCSEDTITMR